MTPRVTKTRAQQAEMFAKPARPHVWRMHVIDAGYASGGLIAELKCARCGHQTGWLTFQTVTEAKRGLPCPKCNADRPSRIVAGYSRAKS